MTQLLPLNLSIKSKKKKTKYRRDARETAFVFSDLLPQLHQFNNLIHWTNTNYDRVEAKTRKSQASFQII